MFLIKVKYVNDEKRSPENLADKIFLCNEVSMDKIPELHKSSLYNFDDCDNSNDANNSNNSNDSDIKETTNCDINDSKYVYNNDYNDINYIYDRKYIWR